MLWGEEWGGQWGGETPTIETHAEDGEARLRAMFFNSVTQRAIANLKAARAQNIENAIQEMFTIWRLGTAAASRQDDVGTILVLPRQGAADDEYTKLLDCQARIVLPRRRTVSGLLTLTRCLLGVLGDGSRAIDYVEAYPKGFILTLADVTEAEEVLFRRFLGLARPATYNGVVLIIPSGSFGFDDATATVLTDKLGFSDATATVAGGGVFAHVLPI